ncbi:MAG: 9-O-acetylesterase [Alphaproteobacteria bacterium]|nr:9-O-acetylesterase [Alphaproteobacteria bacterium]MBV9370100.1 9-O-acetylesterase [Alphaproteobacteria bacterium]MBV9901014.1 9-O-acetylesterase [Alphaproteobacteria bacterium]
MSARRALAGAALAVLLASASGAAPTLDPLFSDHAVLQRDHPLAVRGKAEPDERLTVRLGSASRSVTAGKDGAWRAELPPMAAGGPYTLTVTGSSGSAATASDILVGDVWLCSGQSNMELAVGQALNGWNESQSADDPELRLLTVPHRTSLVPLDSFGDPVAWSPATGDKVRGFSAACYYMAKQLRASEKVPVGAINDSWGGTQILPWVAPAEARPLLGRDVGLLDLYKRDPVAANRRFGATWQEWWKAKAGTEPWADPSRLAWKPMPSLSYWETWGVPELANFNGMVWARKTVTLTAQEAARAASLSLGVIDEIDETWVNGVAVGNSFGWDIPREYKLPKGLLHAGENEILVSLFDAYAWGGFQGPAAAVKLSLEGGAAKPLGEGWLYSIVSAGLGEPPRSPWDTNAGASLIHNAMIAPLGRFGFRGVAWYQGESDVSNPAPYADKLAALMAGWRRQFGSPGLPFLIVGLANYGAEQTAPRASGWAELREQQRRAAARDPRAALVVAMDLGERLDIHPANKPELGRRLARAARALAYGASEPVGPEIADASRAQGGVVLRFRGVTGGLATWSGNRALAFELCAETQQSCRFAEAVAEGATVRIAGDGRPFTRVRYAWADTPVTNLYDAAPLPVGPFEVAVP